MAIFYGDFFVAIFNGDIFGDFYGIFLLLFYGDILWWFFMVIWFMVFF